MDIAILLFTVLLAALAMIVAWVVFTKRKRRRGTEKEAQRKGQEEQGRSEVERRQRGEECRNVEKKHGEVKKKKQPSPSKRGGRPRGSTQSTETTQVQEKKASSLRPEIVCWKEGWSWVIGIEVPEELEIQSITQNGGQLEQDNIDERRYRLKQIGGPVHVTWTGGEKDIPLVGAERNCLIFKMRKNWKDPGRLVKHATSGYYLIIIPQQWERDEKASGPASVAPEDVQLNGYKAHFFFREKGSNTAFGFITSNGKQIQVEQRGARFQLVGKTIVDAHEYMGPLFGGQPPCIQAFGKKAWNDVEIIVVGEEGSGRNRWRMQFVPQEGVEKQTLPDEVANRRGGWYFVRVYDKDDNLIESIDFRFLAALNDIRLDSTNFLPDPNGHDNITVQFLHQTDCKVELIDKDIQHALEVRRKESQTIVTIPPKPDYDKTHWILRDGGAEVEITILVERIWWALGEKEIPTNWVDKPIILSRKDFTATTDKALWVRFPQPRFVRKIAVGFERIKSRSYQVVIEKKEIAIPLRDFCDTKEVGNRQEGVEMKIWVQPEEAKLGEAVIVRVPAEQPPPVESKERQVQKDIPNVLQDIQAIVKCRRGKRKGKGFSRNEITKAGMTMKDVKNLHIPYDKRRKTLHSWNVESLKHITER